MILKTALSFVIFFYSKAEWKKIESRESHWGLLRKENKVEMYLSDGRRFASNVSHRYFSRMNGPDAIM